MKYAYYYIILSFLIACNGNDVQLDEQIENIDSLDISKEMRGGLIASRFESLEALKQVVDIQYHIEGDKASVSLRHCSNGERVTSYLEQGIDQGEILQVKRKGNLLDKTIFTISEPKTIAMRKDLEQIFLLARRRPDLYGYGDVAYYDLAEAMVENISTPDLAYLSAKDSSEKGFINTFNHMSAQALITSIFSEDHADFIADVHERLYMPELMTGAFTKEQLTDPNNNPIDNYVDLINNEWGQELGKRLKKELHISRKTYWKPSLLADYLNALQAHYTWAFQIGFKPFNEKDELMIRYSKKINEVIH